MMPQIGSEPVDVKKEPADADHMRGFDLPQN
jgi:hypothetical protein